MPEATVVALIYKITSSVKQSGSTSTMPAPQYEILLTRRKYPPFKDFFCLPGGHINKYESADDAVRREVNEETGLDFTGEFQGKSEEIYPDQKVHNIALVYYGPSYGQIKCNDEVAEFCWKPFTETVGMKLAFGHERILQKYISIFGG